MNNKKFVQKCTLAFSLFLLFLTAGCTTEYGYDYIEHEIIRAERPQYKNLQIQCSQDKTQLSLKLSQQKVLQDYKYHFHQGVRLFQKDFCAYSPEEKKVYLPFLTFFPCVTWGMNLFRTTDDSDGIHAWGLLPGQAVIFNSLMACCDVLYYCGSVCWSIGAVPVHYIRSRSAAEVDSYRSNRPGFISELMGKPIVNLLFPYYIRPDKNPGPMCVKEEFYPRPHIVSKILHKEISSTEYQDIRAGTAVVFSFRGKNYKTQTGKNGKCVLPFKLQPLPARHEKITIQLEVEKTNISLKPVSLTQEFPFDTFKLLSPEQKELWAAVQNPELDLQTRIRTMKRLEALFVPAEFLKFTIDPGQYINSLSK